jgi:uncharacterized protein YgiM (DUF1202 family)
MKMKHWMWLSVVVALAASLLAPPGFAQASDPGTSAPPEKKAAKKKKESAAAELPPEPLGAGPAIARQNNVNVRGQAAIRSEVVTRLQKGERVQVLEEVTLKKPKVDEPARWAKIALPTNAHVWVHAMFIDPNEKTVLTNRLNLRSGPGENYSVLGRIPKGTVVKEIEAKGDWLKIESPPEAYAFVAAHLLVKEPSAPPPLLAVTTPPNPPPTVPPLETTILAPPPAPAPAEPAVNAPPPTATEPVVVPPPTPVPSLPAGPPSILTPVPTPPPSVLVPVPEEEVLVKRVVSREGIVRRSVSIQAPTYFVLENLHNKKTINYLHTTNTNLVLKNLQGKRIIVTGEEMLDERWPNTPVLSVETLQTVP